ncbi:hypothetical protein ACJMK2_039299 [Sinanodonta woodiana]|uniref:EF-hand domain-containing protein n=1 Tax=Sinanodonta woodiana TaxID=1069815 RepID=A0ABD3WBM3_SINWO
MVYLVMCFLIDSRRLRYKYDFGATQSETTSSTESPLTGLHSQANGKAVFTLMDSIILQDNKITFPEFEKVLLQYDSNKDGLLSVQEIGAVLEKLKLGPSSMATTIFAFLDVNPTDSYLNSVELQSLFGFFDTNKDGNIVLSEFMASFNTLQSMIKIFG